jgi:hypothetical protein
VEAITCVLQKRGPYDTQNIQEVIDQITESGAVLGVPFHGYTSLSLTLFSAIPTAVQREILEQLNSYAGTINNIDPALPKNENEKNLLRQVCKKIGLIIPSDFYDTLVGDEIIEIYTADESIQVYRNLEFMKYSSYDFATILLHSLPELFERPPEFHKMLEKRAKEITSEGSFRTQPWSLPKHILVERLHPHLNAFEMDMINIAPVLNEKTRTISHWVSSLRVRPLGSSYQGARNIRPI